MLDPYGIQQMRGIKRRKELRLKGFDYSSPRAYFVTICSHSNRLVFYKKNIKNVIMKTWGKIPKHYHTVSLDKFIIMPNHIHGILWIANHNKPDRSQIPTLGNIVGSFKSRVTRDIHKRKLIKGKIWQRNYFDRIIRNDEELNMIRQYILNNPLQWQFDHENPENLICRGQARLTPIRRKND